MKRKHIFWGEVGRSILEGNGYPVIAVDLVPGCIPERVQYNMPIWRMDCAWWLVLTGSGLQAFLSMYHESNDCTNDLKGLEPSCQRSV